LFIILFISLFFLINSYEKAFVIIQKVLIIKYNTMKKPEFLIKLEGWFKNTFLESREESDQTKESEQPSDDEEKIKAFHIDDTKEVRTAHLSIPAAVPREPFFKNRFWIEFPGIPGMYFNAYKYLGSDIKDESFSRKFMKKNGVVYDDFSEFKVLLLFPGEDVDICEKLKELERNPKVGDVNIHMLDPTGRVIKTILIPKCEVVEIRAFRDLEYGKVGDKKDNLLYGEIVVKHKQRKLI